MLKQAAQWSERSAGVINHVYYCTGNPSWIPKDVINQVFSTLCITSLLVPFSSYSTFDIFIYSMLEKCTNDVLWGDLSFELSRYLCGGPSSVLTASSSWTSSWCNAKGIRLGSASRSRLGSDKLEHGSRVNFAVRKSWYESMLW